MIYKISEIFYSIQGEGFWSGTPMTFIRLAGCNLDCWFCDTNKDTKLELTPEQVIEHIQFNKSKKVCITGGEPTQQDLLSLLNELHAKHYIVHLETNGLSNLVTNPHWSIHWISCSPKQWIDDEEWWRFNEIKWLVGDGQELWQKALDYVNGYKHPLHFLQPVWVKSDYEDNLKNAIELVKRYPAFRLSVQMHKYINIK